MKHKDITIKNIVRHLKNKLGVEFIFIKDYWEADNYAIGVTNKDNKNLVYISTYMKKNNEFFVELECLLENDTYKKCGEFENISVEEVEEIVRIHLNLK